MLSPGVNIKTLIVHYLAELWTRRWLVLGGAWAISLVGCLWVASLSDRYTATSQVYVDTETVLNPLMHGLTVQSDVDRQIEVIRRTLLTRPNLLKLARMTDMDLRVHAPEEEERLGSELNRILEYMEKLNELDTEDVEPTSHVVPVSEAFRQDLAEEFPALGELLSQGPDMKDGYFRVPRIID